VGEENHVMSAWEGPGRGGHKPSSSRSSHTSLLRSLLAKPLQNRYCLMLITFFFFLNFFFKNCHYAVQSLAAGNPACVTGLTKAFPAALEASVANVSGSAA